MATEPQVAAAAAPRCPVPHWAIAAVIVALAFALRVFRITFESVSGDEAFSITLTRDPLGVMMHRLVLDLVHPPLHVLLLRGWLKLFGFGLLQARMLSVIFGTLAVLFLYRPATTIPGLVIVLIGVPVYFAFRATHAKVS